MDELRFEIEECVGTGGFGVVYRARMTTAEGLVRTVAVKSLRADMATPHAIARLRDEARMLAALRHRAILAVHDLVRIDGDIALVSEFVDGADLARLVVAPPGPGTQRSVPSRVAVEVVGEVAGALAAAWTAPDPRSGVPMNLVHRDIKPANIRVSTNGAVKLLDFGIAKSESQPRAASTAVGLVAGTVGYLAPERFTEERVSPASDVYALGLVLFEALTAERLLGDCSRREIIELSVQPAQHDAFVARALARIDDEDPALVALLHDMLQFDPTTRPTAAEVEARAEDLVERLDGPRLRRWARERAWHPPAVSADPRVGCTVSASGLLGLSPTQSRDSARTWAGSVAHAAAFVGPASRRRPRWAGLAIAAFLGIAGGGVGLWWQTGPTVPDAPEVDSDGITAQAAVTEASQRDGSDTPAEDAGAPAVESASASVRPIDASPAENGPVEAIVDEEGSSGEGPVPASSAPRAAKDTPSSTEASRASTAPAEVGPDPVAASFSSYPLGATVEVADGGACTTPCALELPLGQHTAVYSLADGRSAREVIEVTQQKSVFGHRFVRPAGGL